MFGHPYVLLKIEQIHAKLLVVSRLSAVGKRFSVDKHLEDTQHLPSII